MKTILQLEELVMTAAGIYLISVYNPGISFAMWLLLFFSPDISMLGYLINTRVGAIMYNIVHHRGIAAGVTLAGFYTHNTTLIVAGALLFAHSSFDRIMGYGLKYFDSFQHTHLGRIGKSNTNRRAA